MMLIYMYVNSWVDLFVFMVDVMYVWMLLFLVDGLNWSECVWGVVEGNFCLFCVYVWFIDI